MSNRVIESPLSNQAIAEYAERVGEHHDIFQGGEQADLARLVKSLGGFIDVSNSFVADEALTVRDHGDFTVHLPPMTSDRRDRFTIAHELGHYFLHYLLPRLEGQRSFGRGAQNRAETQANFFAASLLMPAARFATAYKKHGGDAWALADMFGVSPKAAEVRAQVLRLGR